MEKDQLDLTQNIAHETKDYDEVVCDTTSEPSKHPYTRAKVPHRSVEPVDDFAHDDEGDINYTHDTNFVSSKQKSFFDGRRTRSKNAMPLLEKDLHYGQYLEVPKSRNTIFTNTARKRRKRYIITIIILVLLVAILLALLPYIIK